MMVRTFYHFQVILYAAVTIAILYIKKLTMLNYMIPWMMTIVGILLITLAPIYYQAEKEAE